MGAEFDPFSCDTDHRFISQKAQGEERRYMHLIHYGVTSRGRVFAVHSGEDV